MLYSQLGPLQILDSSVVSSGASHLSIADLNNDGQPEVIASFTGSNGKVGFYENLGNNSFSTLQVVDSLAFSKGVATGDFDQDGHTDLVAIGGTGMEARLYFNNSGSFGAPVSLDSNISIAVNDVVTADFDGNNSPDIVIIGQHSIDFFRNNGSGQFTKEAILTTSTSPKPLECLDLATTDIDTDGDIDLVCGETAGLVVYTNSGSGQFTPNYYSSTPEIGFVVHPFDIDGDTATDVIMRPGSGDVKWFSNDGTGSLTLEATLATLPDFYNMKSIDYNADGREDLYASYLHNVSVFLNDSSNSFSTEVSIQQDNSLIMGPIAIGQIDNQNARDYLWAGVINTVAYHLNQNGLAAPHYRLGEKGKLYPNPTYGLLHLPAGTEWAVVCNQQGKVLRSFSNVQKIDLSSLPAGVYHVSLRGSGFEEVITRKVVKY